MSGFIYSIISEEDPDLIKAVNEHGGRRVPPEVELRLGQQIQPSDRSHGVSRANTALPLFNTY